MDFGCIVQNLLCIFRYEGVGCRGGLKFDSFCLSVFVSNEKYMKLSVKINGNLCIGYGICLALAT